MVTATDSQRTVNKLMVSLKTLSWQLDADRSTVRRWLREAGVKCVTVGRGRNASIRYRTTDIEAWIQGRKAGN